MYDLSVFIKELKGRFAQWYNQRHDRYGVLWAERFKSVLKKEKRDRSNIEEDFSIGLPHHDGGEEGQVEKSK